MTSKQILEFNKMCAKYLGWLKIREQHGEEFIEIISDNLIEWLPSNIYGRTSTGKYQFELNLCKFHEDWNWIHEVIDKIQKKHSTSITGNSIKHAMAIHMGNLEAIFGQGNTKKEAVIVAIVKFLLIEGNINE